MSAAQTDNGVATRPKFNWGAAIFYATVGLILGFALFLLFEQPSMSRWERQWAYGDPDGSGVAAIGAALGLAVYLLEYGFARFPAADPRRWAADVRHAAGLSILIGALFGVAGSYAMLAGGRPFFYWLSWRGWDDALGWAVFGAVIGGMLYGLHRLSRRSG